MRLESEGGNVKYKPEDRPLNPSPNDRTIALPLRDGTHIIFPFDLDESSYSDELSGGPPSLDSDGNDHYYDQLVPPDSD